MNGKGNHADVIENLSKVGAWRIGLIFYLKMLILEIKNQNKL